ncbi:hypothetical protein BDY21DRAFT_219175 [Lineolata rhizophorae]|uniref:Uncharacterized protein n=1 Tax=Lineolata rhizophorae TaxID=578093 RepID=A0A6A6P3E2_9PEZI|nr:hypothetical protein BDY21DRAFT_219175 [Lineolata rhizophorae]
MVERCAPRWGGSSSGATAKPLEAGRSCGPRAVGRAALRASNDRRAAELSSTVQPRADSNGQGGVAQEPGAQQSKMGPASTLLPPVAPNARSAIRRWPVPNTLLQASNGVWAAQAPLRGCSAPTLIRPYHSGLSPVARWGKASRFLPGSGSLFSALKAARAF